MPRDLRDSVVPRQASHRQLERGSRKPTTDGRRVCARPGCTTQLSRYNLSEVCGTHAGWQDQRQRHHA